MTSQAEEEDEDEVVEGDEDEGEDSEKEAPAEGGSDVAAKGPVAESLIEAQDMAMLVASGAAETYYAGPTPRQMLRWRRRGSRW